MYPIGSYAVPQIQSVNPDMEIDSFVFPGSDKKEENTLNSGIDLQFCVTKECKNKEAAYEVLDFLLEDENVQDYLNEQNSVPCKEGEFELSPMLDGVRQYIEEENNGRLSGSLLSVRNGSRCADTDTSDRQRCRCISEEI